MTDLTRRDLVGAGALAMAGGVFRRVGLAQGAETAAADAENPGAGLPWSGPGSEKGDWAGTPDEIKALGGCTMPLAELNRRRKMYIDSFTEDYVCEDGTTIPVAFVKATRLVGTYGYGIGNEATDKMYRLAYEEMTEEEARGFIEMPMGKQFNVYEFAVESGRGVEECEVICESLFNHAWLNRVINDRGTLYLQVPHVQGILEYHDPDWFSGRIGLSSVAGMAGPDVAEIAFNRSGSPFFGPIPVNKDVVKDGAIYPFDDVKAVWATKSKFSLSPCTCRLIQVASSGQQLDPNYPGGDYDLADVMADACGHRLETCLSCGEEAQFWIDHGVGREVSYEEAMAVIDQSIEEGLILQHTMSKESETICSCHGDCCGVMGKWKALGGADALAASTTFKQVSHYNLEVDLESCIACGTCAARCPMEAITMDGEDGKPQVNATCFKCGQCAYVCPAQARVLVPRPEEELLPLCDDTIDMNNMLAAQRFEAGLIW